MTTISGRTTSRPVQENQRTLSIISMRKVKKLRREAGEGEARKKFGGGEDKEALSYARSLRLEAKTQAILHTTGGQDDEDADDYAAQKSSRRRGSVHELNKSQMAYKMSRFLLETIGQLCFVDLFACEHFKNEANRIRFALLRCWPVSKFSNKLLQFHRLDRSDWFIAHKSHRLGPRLVFALWLAACAHTLVFMTRQYQYDFHRFRLKRVHWLNRTHPDVYLELGLESEDYLREQLKASRAALLSVGSIRGDFSYLPQCFCLVLLIVTLLCYFLAWLFTKFSYPFDFYFIRNFLDHKREQRNCHRLVEQQAHYFVESSRSFTQALMEFSELSLGKKLFAQSVGERPDEQQRQVAAATGGEDLASMLATAYWGQQQLAPPAGGVEGELSRDKPGPLITTLDSLSCRQMARMMASGLLEPINQSTRWIAKQADRYARMKLAALAYCTLMDLILVGVLYALQQYEIRATSWRDLLLAIELLFLLTILNISTVFYSFTVMFCSYDQIQLATQLRKLIKHVVALNNLRFHAILKPAYRRLQQQQQQQQQVAPSGALFSHTTTTTTTSQNTGALRRRRGAVNLLLDMNPSNMQTSARRPSLPVSPNFRRKSSTVACGPLAELQNIQPSQPHGLITGAQVLANDDELAEIANKMNNDLLLAVMHYRIFFARMVSLIKPFGFVTMTAAVLMFLVPFIGRIHLPYFLLPFEKSVIVLSSCIILIPVNVALIGPAFMHRRGLDLYSSLNSLLAHAMDITNHPEGQHIYDRHLMSLLRKELAMHDGILPRFATRKLGLSFTYPNLVRLHFYLGFLLLSIIGDDQASEEELTGSIFNDPFGLF